MPPFAYLLPRPQTPAPRRGPVDARPEAARQRCPARLAVLCSLGLALGCLPSRAGPAGDGAAATLRGLGSESAPPGVPLAQVGAAAHPDTTLTLRLKDGLQVVLHPQPGARAVAVLALVDTATEPAAQSGLAHLTEHLVVHGAPAATAAPPRRASGVDSRGAEGMPATWPLRGRSLAQSIAGLGGSLDAYTTLDHSAFLLTLARRALPAGLARLAQALAHPPTHAEALRAAAATVIDEIRQGEAAPERALMQALMAAALPGERFHRAPQGREAVVGTLAAAQIEAFVAQRYRAPHVTLILVGDLDEAAARQLVQTAFAAALRAGKDGARSDDRDNDRSDDAPPPDKLPRAGAAPQVVVLQREGRDLHLVLGFRGAPAAAAGPEEAAALHLLAAVLGGAGQGRLPQEVQHNRQLVSEVSASGYTPRGAGLLTLAATLAPPQLDEATQALLVEALRLTREEVSESELSRARAHLESQAVRQQESAAGVARRLAAFATLSPEGVAGAARAAAAYGRALRALTPARLREVASRYLRPEALTIAVLQPRGAPDPAPRRGRSRAQVLVAAVTPAVTQIEPLLQRAVRRALLQSQSEERPASASGAALTAAGPLSRVVTRRLRSGARLLVLPDASVPLVALRAVWPGGQRLEDDHSAGANRLLAALLARSTRTRSSAELRRELQELGGTLRGQAGYSSFGLQGEVLSTHLDPFLRLFSDCLMHPALTDAEVDDERRLVLTALHAQEEDPAQVVLRLFTRALLPRHAYRQDLLGTPGTVAALTRRRLQEFYHRHYPLSQATLVVVGAVSPALVAARLDALLPPQPAEAAAREEPGEAKTERGEPEAPASSSTEAAVRAPRQIIKTMKQPQAHVVLGFRGASVRDPERHALEVLLTVLAGPEGRLRQTLVERRALAFRFEALAVDGLDPGYVALYAATTPERAEPLQAALREELRRLVAQPVTDDELQRAREHLIGLSETGMERRARLAEALALHEVYGLGAAEAGRYAERTLAVDAAAVQRAARRFLDERPAVLAAVLPESLTPGATRRGLLSPPPPPPPPAPLPKGSASAPSKTPPRKGRQGR